MSIPLDRLYHYIESVAKETYNNNIIIYRFFPHGSKNIDNLLPLHELPDWADTVMSPTIYCNDQEPLDYNLYQNKQTLIQSNKWTELSELLDNISTIPRYNNFRYPVDSHDNAILLHSEKRSNNLEKYQQDHFIPVYYWSHAIIAKDWFRYAQHETPVKNIKKEFLIYNRAWSGTREYRLRFAELLIKLNLQDFCQTKINPIEPELGIHYELHKFNNPTWRPTTVLENYFPGSTAQSYNSADFDIVDYATTNIEVVLETLFDDSRLHLTEKSLRPIACGQPFILAATHGSLEYLRSYGFKTFMHLWDERYDTIEDPEERLIAIANLMRQIANWTTEERDNKMAQARIIADYNRQHFFSKEFFDQVVNELKNNLSQGIKQLTSTNTGSQWLTAWKEAIQHPDIINYLNQYGHNPSVPSVTKVMKIINVVKNLNL